MRVDIVVASRELFGSDRCGVRLAEALSRLGHAVTLVVPQDRPERGLVEWSQSRGLNVEEAHVAIASSSGVEAVRGLSRARGRRPDLTVFNTTSVLGVSRPTGAEILVVREWLEPGSARHRLLVRWHQKRVAAVVGISSGVLRQWRALSPHPSMQTVVWDWLDDDWFAPLPGESPRAGVLCVGRFNAWKGQGLLADAYLKAFPRQLERPGMTFVGHQPGGPFGDVGDDIAKRGKETSAWEVVPFTKDVRAAFSRASLVVVPSLHPEPFGGVLLEALASGCRVLATRGGGPDDLMPIFSPVLTVIEPEEDAMAHALSQWASDGARPQTTEQRAETANSLREHFSGEAGTRRWQELLGSVAALSR